MKKTTLCLLAIIFFVSGSASAGSKEEKFSLFKRTISPIYDMGGNGLISVPKATPLDGGTLFAGVNVKEAGKVNNEDIYLVSGSLMVGLFNFLEVGYTNRHFIWDDSYSDISMDTLSAKARVFNSNATILPDVAVGVNAVSLNGNEFEEEEDVLFNPYVAATFEFPVIENVLDISTTATAETVYNDGDSGDLFFSAGTDIKLFNFLYLLTEFQGINKEDEDCVVNLGAKAEFGWLSVGATIYNAIEGEIGSGDEAITEDSSHYSAYANVKIPFGKIAKKSDNSDKSDKS